MWVVWCGNLTIKHIYKNCYFYFQKSRKIGYLRLAVALATWYNKNFKNIINKTGTYSIVAHNGILCGNADSLNGNNGKKNFATIVLLKDKYRPYMDVARDGVRGLTLETASEIEIIENNLANQGFEMVGNMLGLREENYSNIVMADYCKLLGERDDLAKQLVFNTSEGFLSIERLAGELLKKEKIMYKAYPTISNKSFGLRKEHNLYKNLCVAFLRENYSLQINIKNYGSEVFISKKEKELPSEYKKIFPVCLFLPEMNNKCDILTYKEVYWRYACNEYHRLSQFILKNGNKLNKYVPGIFKELLRVLMEDEGDKLIGNVNSLLENLRKFPGGLFEVPEELFLSEKDLI